MRAMDIFCQWFQIQLEQQEWQYHKQIIVNDDDDTRKNLISLPLPPLVLKVTSEWYWPLRNEIIDFTFRIKIERQTSLNDDCSYSRLATPSYKCVANLVVRLKDGTIYTNWEIPRRIFQLEIYREVEQISLQNNSFSEQSQTVFFRIREFYNNVLNYRLNKLYGKLIETFAFTGRYLINRRCFESSKLQQAWPDFMETKSINWDSQHHKQQRLFGNIRKNDCVRELGILTRYVSN